MGPDEAIVVLLGIGIPVAIMVSWITLGLARLRSRHRLELERRRTDQDRVFFEIGTSMDIRSLGERMDRLEAQMTRIADALTASAARAAARPRRLDEVPPMPAQYETDAWT